MEIEALSKQIISAIETKGSVTFTGIGTISAIREAAKLSEDGTLIEPPAVVPVFNPYCDQKQESGEEYSGQIKRAIIERGRAVIPGIGEISLDENGVFKFNPAKKCALNADFFFLEPIPLQPKVNFTETPAKETTDSESIAKKTTGEATGYEIAPAAAENNANKEKTTKTKAIVVYTVASIVILALLLYAFRNELSPLMERLLYSKDELELMKQLNL